MSACGSVRVLLWVCFVALLALVAIPATHANVQRRRTRKGQAPVPVELEHEPFAVVPATQPPVLLETGTQASISHSVLNMLDTEARAKSTCMTGYRCPIVDGVCCGDGASCCPWKCKKKGLKWKCTSTDAQKVQRALLLLKKQKAELQADRRKLDKQVEQREARRYKKWVRSQAMRRWKSELLGEKRELERALRKKKADLIKKLEKMGKHAGINVKDFITKVKKSTKKKHTNLVKGLNPQEKKDVLASILKLKGEWSNYGGEYDPARVQKWQDVCFVSGMVRGKSGLITTLPKNCRPQGGRLVFTQIKDNRPVRVDVLVDGRVYQVTGENPGWLSLSGLTFSAKNGTDVFLTDGWQSTGGKFRPAQIKRYGDACLLSGVIRTAGKWAEILQVPKQCHPQQRVALPGNNHKIPVQLDIYKNGSVALYKSQHKQPWLSLDGLVYTRRMGTKLPLLNKAKKFSTGKGVSPYMSPHYWRAGNLVMLSGQVVPGTNGLLAKLPPGYRPFKRLVFGTDRQNTLTRVDVLPNGNILYVGSGAKNVNLNGVSYYVMRRDNKAKVAAEMAGQEAKRSSGKPIVNLAKYDMGLQNAEAEKKEWEGRKVQETKAELKKVSQRLQKKDLASLA